MHYYYLTTHTELCGLGRTLNIRKFVRAAAFQCMSEYQDILCIDSGQNQGQRKKKAQHEYHVLLILLVRICMKCKMFLIDHFHISKLFNFILWKGCHE